jgi:hypothetical protein
MIRIFKTDTDGASVQVAYGHNLEIFARYTRKIAPRRRRLGDAVKLVRVYPALAAADSELPDTTARVIVVFSDGAYTVVRFNSYSIAKQWAMSKHKRAAWPAPAILTAPPGHTVRGDRARVTFNPEPPYSDSEAVRIVAKPWCTYRDDGSVGGMAAGAAFETLPEAIAHLERLGHRFPPEAKTAQ